MTSITCALCGSPMALVAERYCTPVIDTRTGDSGFGGVSTDHRCASCGFNLTITGRPACVLGPAVVAI